MSDHLAVMAIKPFWRYCVIPYSLAHREAAIPYYTRRGADALVREMVESGSMFSTLLVYRKRRWRWRQIDPIPVAIIAPEHIAP